MAREMGQPGPPAGWRLVSAPDIGNPDAPPPASETVVASPNLPGAEPPKQGKDTLAGDIVTVVGLVAAIIIALLVHANLFKSAVAAMKPYDEAKKSALIAALLVGLLVAAIAVAVGQFALKG